GFSVIQAAGLPIRNPRVWVASREVVAEDNGSAAGREACREMAASVASDVERRCSVAGRRIVLDYKMGTIIHRERPLIAFRAASIRVIERYPANRVIV